MYNENLTIETPADLEWEEPGAVSDFVTGTFLYTEVEMWGITKAKSNSMPLNDSPFNEIHSGRLSWSIVNEEETHLCATAVIWGVLFHIDAVEVNERGEALDKHGARHIACLIERNGDLSDDESFVTVELIPGRHYVITFEPGITYAGLSQQTDIEALVTRQRAN